MALACTALASLLLSVGAPAGALPGQEDIDALVERVLAFAADQLDAAVASFATNRYPSTTGTSGSWSTTGPSDWTSGFFPGCLWAAHEWSGAALWRTRGEAWISALEGESDDTSTHDVGFKIFPSFEPAWRLTGDDADRLVVLEGAASLATRYSPIVGATRSWNGPTSADFRVIIDNMMNLEILLWGARNGGDPAWRAMAVSHALRTRAEHVRADGSTYQIVNFDPATGAVKWKDTHQGYAAESTWSRGQAWAVHGFTMVFRETGDARFLETARAAADYFLAHLPADHVPYWDLDLPSTAGEPRDSSAAAIAAAGLLELARLEPVPAEAARWLAGARAILVALGSPAYLAEGTAYASVLLHGTQNRPDGRYDTGLVYGDYYLMQALLRHRAWFGGAPFAEPVTAAASAGVPLELVLAATDAEQCELVFELVDLPAHGSLGVPSDDPCMPGAPNRDTARVTYVSSAGFSGVDTFTYRASDGVDSSAPALVTVTVGSAGGAEHVFACSADSQAKSTSPGTNYGSDPTLRIRAGEPEYRTYVKFAVTGLAGAVEHATLRLFVTDGSDDAGRVHATASGWTESGLTWSNAPAPSGPALDAAGAATDGTWIELDVTPAVQTDGSVSFVLVSLSTTSAYFSSREGGTPPELVVTTRGAGGPPLHVPASPPQRQRTRVVPGG
jgi:unsaturated chondroitin disaccharide hydrolase